MPPSASLVLALVVVAMCSWVSAAPRPGERGSQSVESQSEEEESPESRVTSEETSEYLDGEEIHPLSKEKPRFVDPRKSRLTEGQSGSTLAPASPQPTLTLPSLLEQHQHHEII